MKFSAVVAVAGVLLGAGCAAPGPAAPGPRAPLPSPDGVLVLSDVQGDRLLRFDASTGARLKADPSWDTLPGPAGLCEGPDGELLVASFDNHELLRLGGPAREASEVLFRDPLLLEEPVAVLGHEGDLLLLGNDTRNVARLSQQGELLALFGDGDLKEPHDFALGPDDGLLYIATAARRANLGLIQVFDPDTGERLRDFARPELLLDAVGLAFDRDGSLLVSDWFGQRVLRFDPASGALLEVVLSAADGLTGPLSLVVEEHGFLLIDRDDVLRVSDQGGAELLVSGEEHGLRWPRGLQRLR